jgi:sulfite reductase (NADPH) hemoprotein beta-component
MLEITSRAMASKVVGPGILPEVRPLLPMMNGDYSHWLSTNVRSQKQADYCMVTGTIPLGDVTSEQMRVLGDLTLAYGDGAVRVTSDQDLVFRWVRTRDVPELHRRLSAAGLGLPDADTMADVTSCPGAESCKLAVTQSRGLGKYLGDHLRARPDLIGTAPDLTIKISGCPNGCGRHHIAGLGFQGSVRKVGTRAVPQYFVLVGGGLTEEGAQFGRLAAKVPARRLWEAFERLIWLYQTERHNGETATAFFMGVEVARVKEVLADLERLTPEDAGPEDFVDLGEEAEFNPEIQEGECSA